MGEGSSTRCTGKPSRSTKRARRSKGNAAIGHAAPRGFQAKISSATQTLQHWLAVQVAAKKFRLKTPPDDPFQLERFVSAQRDLYATALEELKRGAKQSHWMWFIFPQVAGLGRSAMADRFAIRSRQEAQAYLEHPVLGPRLRECATALLTVTGKTAREVMGYPDDLKLRSSMTLFAAVSPPDSPFHAVLARYFSGQGDERTADYLAAHESN